MKDFEGFTAAQRKAVADAQEALAKVPLIPCTSCDYCAKVCPMEIGISGTFTASNLYTLYANMDAAKGEENWLVGGHKRKRANECIQCGACEEVCPQHISIREELEKACALFGF